MNIEYVENLSPSQESTACKLLASLIETGSFSMPPYPSKNKAGQIEQLKLVITLCRFIEFSLDKRMSELAGWVNGTIVDNQAEMERIEAANRQRYFGTDLATVSRKKQAELSARQDAENANRRKAERQGLERAREESLRQMAAQIR